MPKHAKAAPDWNSDTGKAASRKAYTPVQLKGALVNGFMDEYARSGDACWKILAKENPEGFLRLGAYLAPKEMQLEVFMSSTSDAEIDAMIEVLREKVLEAKASPPMKLIEQKVTVEMLDDPEKARAALARLEAIKAQRLVENKLANFTAYKKQREFFAAGKKHRERLLMAANRFGKTECGAAEMSYHLTGQYPPDWPGKRFDKPVRAWAAGVTSETTRDVVQAKLIGPPFTESEWGQGMVPKSCIIDIAPARGIPAAIDTVSIRHVSGGTSALQFKSFERGREKWQGAACEVIWFDEECPPDIYSEGLTRTNETGGIVFITFTPLDGVTEVVRRFLHEKNEDRHVTQATIDDAPHFSAADKKRIIASYLPHEAEARIKGVPVLGSGRIFPIPESSISIEPLASIPKHWPRIGGLDFGYEHPAAAVELAWDRDTDTVYVIRAWREKHTTPVLHAAALRSWGKRLIWTWPRDGRRETLEGAGISLAKQYTAAGLLMTRTHANIDDGTPGGSVSVEAGLMDMLDRMQTGRFKVYNTLNDWFEEFRLYHRKDGKVVKLYDDLMAATRYAVMMLREAKTLEPPPPFVMPRRTGGGWMSA